MAYFDLEYRLRTDLAFRDRVDKLAKQLNTVFALAQSDTRYVSQFQRIQYEIIKLCKFNMALMTGFYFPRYPRDEALSFADYPFAYHLFNIQIGGFTLIRGSRQISKSTAFAVRQTLNADLYPGFKSVYISPRSQQLTTYANKLRDIERAYRHSGHNPKHTLRKNLNYKEFSNQSSIELAYVLTNASIIRGKSCEEILFDEFQDFDPELLMEVKMIQSASKTPITIYAGTSLTTDTALEVKWNESSQGSWVMKCSAGHYNIPLPEHGVMDMIQAQGPSCSKCGKLLDVRNGRFIHAATDMLQLESPQVGLHIPQIIVPSVYKDKRRWEEIFRAKSTADHRKFLQEILGIATEEGERELTRTHLMNICTLGNDIKKLKENARKRKYTYVISGCDWGGASYLPAEHTRISTTVHVVLGVTFDKKFDIIHMRRYTGMNYDDIIGDIVRNHQDLLGMAIATDFGVGAVYNDKLRGHLPMERHLLFNYTGPSTQLISEPAGAHMYNQWSLNKTESISLTYEAVRSQRIRSYAWEFASEHLLDFLSMYRAPAESTSTGAATFHYRSSASKPNDTLQAVNYAHMLGKILLGEPMLSDMSTKIRLENSLRSTLNYASNANLPHAFSR